MADFAETEHDRSRSASVLLLYDTTKKHPRSTRGITSGSAAAGTEEQLGIFISRRFPSPTSNGGIDLAARCFVFEAMTVRPARRQAIMLLAFGTPFARAMGTTLWRVSTPLDPAMLDAQMRFLRADMARLAGNDVVVVGIPGSSEGAGCVDASAPGDLSRREEGGAMQYSGPGCRAAAAVLPFLASDGAADANYDLILTPALVQAAS